MLIFNLLNNMKVFTKILSGYVIALIMMVAIGSIGLYQLHKIDQVVTDLADGLAKEQHLADIMTANIMSVRFYANEYIRNQHDDDLKSLNQALASFEALLTQAKKQIIHPNRTRLLTNIQTGIQSYKSQFEQIIELINTRKKTISEILDQKGPLAENTLEKISDTAATHNNVELLDASEYTQHHFLLMRLSAFKFFQEGDKNWVKTFEKDYQLTKAGFARLHKFEVESIHQVEEQAKIAVEFYYKTFQKLKIDYLAQQEIIEHKLDAIGPKLKQHATDMSQSIEADFQAQNQATHTLVKQTDFMLYVIMSIVAVLSLFFGYLISRGIMKQLGGEPNLVAEIAKRIAEGDLSAKLIDTKKTTGLLASMQHMQSQLQARIDEDKRIAQEAFRINSALNNATTCMLITDKNYCIIYLNEAAKKLFSKELNNIRKDLHSFHTDHILGANINNFHKNPEHQRKILNQLNATHRSRVVIGGVVLDHVITPVVDENGDRLGMVVEFTDKTLEVATEQEINQVIQAASEGNFEFRINLEGKTGFFKTFGESLNQILEFTYYAIEDTMRMFSAMSKGDLTQTIEKEYTGTFEKLKNDANETVTRLTEIITSIHETSTLVNTAANEISKGNLNLSQRTEEQAASLEQTAASMEQMTSTVQQNADNARQANQLAIGARDQAEKGGEVVSTAVRSMAAMTESSKKVADIIGVIDEIAFQTNLLALNAAVEAARAGEQGRGFAVVASEVRNLAQRSATAAKEIKELIRDSVNKVEEGTKLVNQSGETLTQIVTAVKKVSDIIAEIAAASQEQSSGIHQVNKAISQMDEMTQQNAALVEQAASASEALMEQASNLKDKVAFFNIGTTSLMAIDTINMERTNVPQLISKKVVHSEPTMSSPPKPVHHDYDHDSDWEDF